MAKEMQKQHYVPKFLLDKFAFNPKAKTKRVHIFDKWEEKGYANSTKNVGCKNSLYDVDEMSLEPALQHLDGRTSQVVQKILSNETLAILDQEELVQLTLFLCVQMVRTMQQRDANLEFKKAVYDWAERETGARVVNGDEEPDERDDQIFFLSQLRSCVEYLKYFEDKIWSLMKAPDGETFIIGDCPFVKSNMLDSGPRGNLGLACEGIELYLPLSKKITLAIFCPTWGDQILHSLNLLRNIVIAGKSTPDHIAKMEQLKALEDSMTGGQAYIADPQNVLYVNSLQVQQARRYIFSSKNDFALAQEMIEDHPDLKEGLKLDLSNFYRD